MPEHNPLAGPLDEISIELTQRCNLSCAMCAVWEGRRDGLSGTVIGALLAEARNLGARSFVPSGAETLMRKDALDLLDEAVRLGFERIELVTNGALVPRFAARLARIVGLHLNISIDGPPPVHDALRGAGSYDDAIAGLDAARHHGISVSLSSVLMRPTMATLSHVLDLAVSRELSSVSLQPFQPEIAGIGRDHSAFEFPASDQKAVVAVLADFAARARAANIAVHTEAAFATFVPYLFDRIRPVPPGGCRMPARFLLVDMRGETYPCFFLRGKSMGNVARGLSLSDIWHSADRLRLQLLGLSGRCGGCLAACSDMASYAGSAQS
jgi:MoaA/NifB/PqqE/SkfB family radical SAM enzyme